MSTSFRMVKEYLASRLALVERSIFDFKAESCADLMGEVSARFHGGKRLRPMLALLIGEMYHVDKEKCIKLAAVSELIHIATLLHDDVIDNNDMRHGLPTTNSVHSNKTSILVGDFFLGAAFSRMLELYDIYIMRVMAKCMTRMVQGELMQMASIGNCALTQDQYINIVDAKTAELFAATAESAALLADLPKSITATLVKFGRNLGTAFQIFDDILDYQGDPEQMNKNNGSDFMGGLVTLPVILTLQKANAEEKKFWHEVFADPQKRNADSLAQAKAYLAKSGALDSSVAVARLFYRDAAVAWCDILSPSEAKNMLNMLLHFSVNRVR
jgi:octaprenyl-diphosphate synthase